MQTLYPMIKPYRRHDLRVDDLHTLYIEESGNDLGIPVLFVHGGPGGGCEPWYRRFFDPARYRIILFDQRGAGKSTPHAEIRHNDTQVLLDDMERIRDYLKIERWMLFGGSWGATLALLYAQAWPERVLAMVLRGVFLARQRDLDWLYRDGANRVFPDAWRDFVDFIPEGERIDLLQAYYNRLTGKDEIARLNAARRWAGWETHIATLRPSVSLSDHMSEPHTALALSRIETHFFRNNCFIEENQILRNASKLDNIPGIIVHGRYDMVCPLDQGLALNKAWRGSTLQIVREGAHASSEPAMTDALVRATEEMAEICGNREADRE